MLLLRNIKVLSRLKRAKKKLPPWFEEARILTRKSKPQGQNTISPLPQHIMLQVFLNTCSLTPKLLVNTNVVLQSYLMFLLVLLQNILLSH